jgi:hypothetical protein
MPSRVRPLATEPFPTGDWTQTPMNDEDVDELGPVDYVVVEFPADEANFSGEMAAELTALVK